MAISFELHQAFPAGSTTPGGGAVAVLDLLDSASPWVINEINGQKDVSNDIAALKGGGITEDSPLVDGSRFSAALSANSSVTLSLIGKSADIDARRDAFVKFTKMRETALDFQTTGWEQRLVYIKMQTRNDAGPRYALVRNLTLSLDGDLYACENITMQLTIDREPFWRSLPPADNPKLYSFEYRDEPVGNLSLAANATEHYVSATLMNIDARGAGISATPRPNFIDVPAPPGDVPALAIVTLFTPTPRRVYMGRQSQRISGGFGANLFADLNAYRGGLVSLTNGASITNLTITDQSEVTVPAVVVQAVFAAGATAEHTLTRFTQPQTLIAGRYRVLVRMRLSSGSADSIRVYAEIVNSAQAAVRGIRTNPVTPISSPSQEFKLMDLGVVDIPAIGQPQMRIDGVGQNTSSLADVRIRAEARPASTAGTIRISDVMLMPVDENYGVLEGLDIDDGTATETVHYAMDSTDYFGRGKGDRTFAQQGPSLASGLNENPEFKGGALIRLEPGKVNRIHFIMERYNASGDVYSPVIISSGSPETFQVAVNIIPRWQLWREV